MNVKFSEMRWFSIFVAFSTILNMYRSPIPGITMGELGFIGFIIYFTCKRRMVLAIGKTEFWLLLFIVYTVLYSMLLYTFDYATTGEMIRAVRFIFYYLTACFWIRDYVDLEVFRKWTTRIAKVSVMFICLQYILFYGFNRILLGVIPRFMYVESYRAMNYERFYSYSFRPCAFFSEPAHMAQFLCLPLILSLFDRKKEDWGCVFLCLAGMVLSTSGQAILLGAAILGFYFIWRIRNDQRYGMTERKFWSHLLIVAVLCMAAFFLIPTDLFQNAAGRLHKLGDNSAIYARLHVYSYAFAKGGLLTMLFGNGYGALAGGEGVFVPGFVHIYYGTGVIGLGLTALFFLGLWRRGNSCAKCTVLIFVIMLFGTSLFMNLAIIPYLAVMFLSTKENEIP